jgi:hypothetical protein
MVIGKSQDVAGLATKSTYFFFPIPPSVRIPSHEPGRKDGRTRDSGGKTASKGVERSLADLNTGQGTEGLTASPAKARIGEGKGELASLVLPGFNATRTIEVQFDVVARLSSCWPITGQQRKSAPK